KSPRVAEINRSGAISTEPSLLASACMIKTLHPGQRALPPMRRVRTVETRSDSSYHLRQPDDLATLSGRDSWLCDPASRRVCSYRVLRCPSVVTLVKATCMPG